MGRVPPIITLTPRQQLELELIARSASCTARQMLRARVILLAAAGYRNDDIAVKLNTTPTTVSHWRNRFAQFGIAGLTDAPRPGRPATPLRSDLKHDLENLTDPPDGHSRWTCRSMAELTGVSPSTVQRVWAKLNLRPHLGQTSSLFSNPHDQPRLWNIVGLYIVPPVQALVLSSSAQSQAGQPQRPVNGDHLQNDELKIQGHDRTIEFCALLKYLDEKITAQNGHSHNPNDWIGFLRRVNRDLAPELELHLIMNSCATRKLPQVKQWHRQNPRVLLHSPVPGTTWLNEVELFFSDQTQGQLPGSLNLNTLNDLCPIIYQYLASHETQTTGFVWNL